MHVHCYMSSSKHKKKIKVKLTRNRKWPQSLNLRISHLGILLVLFKTRISCFGKAPRILLASSRFGSSRSLPLQKKKQNLMKTAKNLKTSSRLEEKQKLEWQQQLQTRQTMKIIDPERSANTIKQHLHHHN